MVIRFSTLYSLTFCQNKDQIHIPNPFPNYIFYTLENNRKDWLVQIRKGLAYIASSFCAAGIWQKKNWERRARTGGYGE
jgi:hypothetical protein